MDGDTPQTDTSASNAAVRFDLPSDGESHTIKNELHTQKRRPWKLKTTSSQAILDKPYRGRGMESDPFLVEWLDNDPENPQGFSDIYKWSITALISSMSLCVALASSTYSGAIGPLIKDFGASNEVIIFGLSLMVLGFAIGPLVWAPISEAYGRRSVFLITFAFYTLWTAVTCASQNIWSVLVFRFLAGVFGSSALVIPGGQIADMFPTETRGLAIGVFCATPFVGPSLGPLVGGFLGEAGGWRWVMGLLSIYSALLTFLGFLLMPETCAPVLLRRRGKKLSEATRFVYLTARDAEKPLSISEMARDALVRPWILLFLEPIVLITTIYISCIYGTLYMCFAAFPIMFQQGRGWSAGVGGLAFLGIFVGMMIAVVIVCYDNRRYVRICKETGGYAPPECRLPPAIFGGGLVIVGLAMLAATSGPDIFWIVPIIAGAPFAAGFVLVILALANYLIDAYVIYAASVLAANSAMRSLFGAVFPLFTTYMYQNLGIHWATAVPGFIALLCFPFPILFWKYGEKVRRKCKYATEAARILEALKSGAERRDMQNNSDQKSFSEGD